MSIKPRYGLERRKIKLLNILKENASEYLKNTTQVRACRILAIKTFSLSHTLTLTSHFSITHTHLYFSITHTLVFFYHTHTHLYFSNALTQNVVYRTKHNFWGLLNHNTVGI